MASIDWLMTQISRHEEELAEMQAAFNGEEDTKAFVQRLELIRGVKDHILQLNIHKIVAQAVEKLCLTVNTIESNVSTELRRIEARVGDLEKLVQSSEVQVKKQYIFELKKECSEVKHKCAEVTQETVKTQQSVLKLFQSVSDAQKYVDKLDNRLQSQNTIVHLLDTADPDSSLKKLLEGHSRLLSAIDTAHPVGSGSSHKMPTLVCFTMSAKQSFYKLSRTNEFKRRHPSVSVVDDETTLFCSVLVRPD